MIAVNTLHHGDCLDWMQRWLTDGDRESIDLIYLDPPFQSAASYRWRERGSAAPSTEKTPPPAAPLAFEDRWHWDAEAARRHEALAADRSRPTHDALLGLTRILGHCGMLAYLGYLAERLEHMHALLKPSGSLYLHCDPNASHYLKIVLDALFGRERFVNELIWHYKNASRGKRRWAKAHDVIFWYSKTDAFTFNREDVLLPFESGMTRWRYERGAYRGRTMPQGKTPDDVLVLPALNTQAKERLGYPTQKPETLLERIVLASSNEGDVVLDPFCGSGTACAVAQRLRRHYLGIDQAQGAICLAAKRLA